MRHTKQQKIASARTKQFAAGRHGQARFYRQSQAAVKRQTRRPLPKSAAAEYRCCGTSSSDPKLVQPAPARQYRAV